MTFNFKQKTGFADGACVALLCMTTTMLVGFSTPPASSSTATRASNLSVEVEPLQGAANELIAPSLTNAPASTDLKDAMTDSPKLGGFKVKTRPVSFASAAALKSVLLDLNEGLHFSSAASTKNLAVITSKTQELGKFEGVGFPNIRTHKQAKRSPFAPPGPWAPLVAWRDVQDNSNATQPIASVRCMGLSPQAVAKRADRYVDSIYALAEHYNVDPQLIKAVITEESCFNDQALSYVGAQGLMQLMPDTATWLKVADPLDPQQNLKGGVRYLASLQKEFENIELVLAAYNAGPGNVRRYAGIPPFAETQAYVQKVQANYRRYEAAHRMLFPVQDSPAELESGSL